jgi:taurine transport system permease protein
MSSYEIPAVVREPAAKQPAAGSRLSLSTRSISGLTLFVLLAIWWAVTASGLIEPLFLPPPSAVLQKGWLLATSGYMDSTLWQHLGASLERIGLGLLFAVLTAVPVGIAIGANRIARGVLDPLIEFYRPIPPLAYLPVWHW